MKGGRIKKPQLFDEDDRQQQQRATATATAATSAVSRGVSFEYGTWGIRVIAGGVVSIKLKRNEVQRSCERRRTHVSHQIVSNLSSPQIYNEQPSKRHSADSFDACPFLFACLINTILHDIVIYSNPRRRLPVRRLPGFNSLFVVPQPRSVNAYRPVNPFNTFQTSKLLLVSPHLFSNTLNPVRKALHPIPANAAHYAVSNRSRACVLSNLIPHMCICARSRRAIRAANPRIQTDALSSSVENVTSSLFYTHIEAYFVTAVLP